MNPKKTLRLIFIALTLPALSLLAADLPYELDLDIEFVRALGELELTDYADMQLSQMSIKYPAYKELINLEKARYFYAAGKSKQADATLAAIKNTSKFYTEALLLKAQVHAARRNFTEAEKTYQEYFNIVKTAPKKHSEREEFKRAIRIFNRVLTELGKGKEAAAILDKLPKEHDNSSQGSERQVAFLKLQAQIDAEAAKQKAGKALDANTLNSIINQLKALQFDRDGVSAASSLQTARAQILLGFHELATRQDADKGKIKRFLEAIKTIKMVDPFLEELEKVRGKDGSLIPEAMYYKGQAIRGNAEVMHFAGKDDLAVKQLKGAATYFETLLTEYPNTSKRSEAMLEHQECANINAKYDFGLKLELSMGDGSSEIEAKMEQAQSLFIAKKYADASVIYAEAIRNGRRSKRLPTVAVRQLICLAQLDRLEEAEALLSYLIDAFPSAKDTGDAAFRFGGILYERAKTEKDAKVKARLEATCLWAWGNFVTLAPSHPKAADVAYAVAQGYYMKATGLAQKANAEKDAAKKEALKEQTREAYRAAIAPFRQLTDVYAAFDKGILAWYKLGWIYYSLESRNQSAEAFLHYYEVENANDPARKDNRLEAIFRAAEQLLFGDTPEDALAHFEEIAKETADGGAFDLKAPKTISIREQAAALLPMTYDLSAEKTRPQIDDIKARQKNLQKSGQVFNRQTADCDTQSAALAKKKEDLQQELADCQETIAQFDLDFDAQARKQAQEVAKTGQVTAEDAYNKLRPTIEKSVKETAEGLVNDMKEQQEKDKNALDSLKGEMDSIDERIGDKEADIKAAEKKLDELKKKITDRSSQFAELEKSIVDIEAEKERQDTAVAEAQAAVEQAEDKDKARKDLEQAQASLARITENMNKAYAEKAKTLTDTAKAELEAWKKLYDNEEADLQETRRMLAHDQDAKALAQARIEAMEMSSKALDIRGRLANAVLQALDKPEDQRLELADNIRKKGMEALGALQKATDMQQACLRQQEEILEKYRREAKAKLAKIAQDNAVLETELKPVKDAFDAKKAQAVAAYQGYLKQYPDGKNTPVVMARMAAAMMELDKHDSAVGTLKELIGRFPEYNDANGECVPTKACQALYSLARAQAEAGRLMEAAATFKRLVCNPQPKMKAEIEGFSVLKLRYIAEKGIEISAFDATYVACQEILKRINAKRPDTADMTKSGIENIYMMAANAAIHSGKPREASATLDNLLAFNPRTAYFFDAKFMAADAKQQMTPPDYDGAEAALNEIINFTKDPVVANQALCKAGELLVRTGDAEKAKQALGRFQMVIDFADYTNPENLPWIEQAIVGYARLNKKLAVEPDMNSKMLDLYRKHFPKGEYLEEMQKLK